MKVIKKIVPGQCGFLAQKMANCPGSSTAWLYKWNHPINFRAEQLQAKPIPWKPKHTHLKPKAHDSHSQGRTGHVSNKHKRPKKKNKRSDNGHYYYIMIKGRKKNRDIFNVKASCDVFLGDDEQD